MMKLIKFALENKSTPFDVKSNKPNLRSHRNAIIGQVTMLHKLYGLRSFSVWKPKKPKTNKRPVFPIINHDNKKDKITKPPHFLCLFFFGAGKAKKSYYKHQLSCHENKHISNRMSVFVGQTCGFCWTGNFKLELVKTDLAL